MNKAVLGVIAVVLIAGGGYYFYQNSDSIQTDDTQLVLSASFACADGTHFIAEFPAGQVDIVVDGTLVRSVPMTENMPQTYENTSHVYVFAGEEVTVTEKATGETTTCAQPLDPNSAPVNFGDAGEGGGSEQPDVTLVVGESIQGKWQSTEDEKFVREFKANDAVTDWYDNEATWSGLFVVFTKDTAPEVPYPLEANAVYIQMTKTGSAADTLYFKVAKLTPEELQLVYMDRGGVLSFTRIQ